MSPSCGCAEMPATTTGNEKALSFEVFHLHGILSCKRQRVFNYHNKAIVTDRN